MPFRDVIGHRRLIDLLQRSLAADSLPPSLIFTGPSGIGKRLVAVAIAQAANCPVAQQQRGTPNLFDACGTCPVCTRIARGMHPDAIVVEPGETGSIRIEPIRDVIERSAYRPFEGRRRVVIIDEADALGAPAQSALLKTLEEPPPASSFVLVTARPDALLATVRSRCHALRFRALSPGEVAEGLIRRGVGETQARAVAATAAGRLGRAVDATAADYVDIRQGAHHVLAEAAASRDPRRRIEAAHELHPRQGQDSAAQRERLSLQLRAMASLLRDAGLLASGAPEALLANSDLRPALEPLARAFAGDRGIRAFEAVDRALVALERNVGVKVVADWVSVNL
jgi:DNA polymerase-3 subunit delta'